MDFVGDHFGCHSLSTGTNQKQRVYVSGIKTKLCQSKVKHRCNAKIVDSKGIFVFFAHCSTSSKKEVKPL
jgi:hypothetical protein